MFHRLLGRHRGLARGVAALFVVPTLSALWLVPTSAAEPDESEAAQEQVLTWTAGNSTSEYASAPETATAGTTTIVFENSVETGNTTNMPHTLTFDTSNPDYNQDVDLDIFASPSDSNGGRHEVEVTLTPGEYRYFCDIPGHGLMTGVLVVTGDGGEEDTTPPEVSAEVSGDQNDDGDFVGSATVTLDATDADSGVETIEYQVDDTGFENYSEPVTVDEPGDHSVQYRATDGAGNTSEVGSVGFTVVEPDPGDTTPPEVSAEVSGDQNDDGDFVGSATVTLDATDADSGVDTVEYDLDGAGWQAYTEPVTVEEPGAHSVQYRATDNAGNTSDIDSVDFAVVEADPGDTTPPEVSAELSGDQDADGNYVSSATVEISASDTGSGVDTVEYDLDGEGFREYSEPVTVHEAGEHMLHFRATDNAGNTSDVGMVGFTVVESESDECPGSDTRDTVIIGTIDTTVPNVDTGDGCTINDLIDENGDHPNHGQFVRHVRRVTGALAADGHISGNERGRITSAAARSDVGK